MTLSRKRRTHRKYTRAYAVRSVRTQAVQQLLCYLFCVFSDHHSRITTGVSVATKWAAAGSPLGARGGYDVCGKKPNVEGYDSHGKNMLENVRDYSTLFNLGDLRHRAV
jgi:hypothetical protein